MDLTISCLLAIYVSQYVILVNHRGRVVVSLAICELVAIVVLVREDVLVCRHLVHQSLYVAESYGAVALPA